MKKIFSVTILSTFLLISGCFSFNFGNDGNEINENNADKEIVLIANSNNVYRLSNETILKVRVQQKDGKWVESKNRVLIPENWYIVSGAALD